MVPGLKPMVPEEGWVSGVEPIPCEATPGLLDAVSLCPDFAADIPPPTVPGYTPPRYDQQPTNKRSKHSHLTQEPNVAEKETKKKGKDPSDDLKNALKAIETEFGKGAIMSLGDMNVQDVEGI